MPPTPDANARSPFAGCLILVLALLMLVALVGFTIWLPFKQADEIAKFTADQPQPLPVESIEGNEARVNALAERLEAFRSDLGDAEKSARLELTADDLNLAIAAFPQGEELRKCFLVREITADSLVIDICYQLNGRPRMARDDEEGFFTADPRYLIGTLHGTPRLGRRELALHVDRLEVPGASVPDGFMSHFAELRIFERYLADPTLGPAMAKLTRADIQDGRLVLSRIPGDPLPETAGEDSIQTGTERLVKWLGIAACLFLAFAATMVILGIRAQKRKARESANHG